MRVDWSKVDWTQTTAFLAATLGVTANCVRNNRAKLERANGLRRNAAPRSRQQEVERILTRQPELRLREIAQLIGVHETYVWQLKNHILNKEKSWKTGQKGITKRVLKLHSDGLTTTEISKTLKARYQTVYSILKNYNCSPRIERQLVKWSDVKDLHTAPVEVLAARYGRSNECVRLARERHPQKEAQAHL